MRVFGTVQLFATLLTATNAADRVKGTVTRILKRSKVEGTFAGIKLTPENELSPFIGVDFASGSAIVKLISNKGNRQVCIQASVEGFIPGLLHIHTGKISENGALVVDFSSLLSKTVPNFSGCVQVTKAVFDDMKLNPVS